MKILNANCYLSSMSIFYYSLGALALFVIAVAMYSFYKNHLHMQKRIELRSKSNAESKNKTKLNQQQTEEYPEENTKINETREINLPPKDASIIRFYDNAADVLWFIGLDGNIKYISRAVKDFLGYESKELINNRAITIFAKNDYPRFEAMCKRLYQDINLLEATFSFKTKGDLLKDGECIIKPYSDIKFGEGYIGSVRPVSNDKIKEKIKGEKEYHALIAEKESLKIDNQNLQASNADLIKKIEKILQEQERQKLITPLEFADFNAQRIGLIRSFFNLPDQKLKEDADKLMKLLAEKRMARYDLVEFCQEVEQQALQSRRLDAFLTAEQALFIRILTEYSPQKEIQNIQKALTGILSSLTPLFKGSKHLINLHINKDVKAEIDILLLKELFIYLISKSLTFNFKNKQQGIIDISITQKEDSIEFTYKDNGTYQEIALGQELYASFFETGEDPLLKYFCNHCLNAKSFNISNSPTFIFDLLC